MSRHLSTALLLLMITQPLCAQRWVELLLEEDSGLEEVRAAFHAEWEGREPERGKGYKAFKRWEWFTEQRVWPHGGRLDMAAHTEAWKAKRAMESMRAGSRSTATWQPLGPTAWTSESYNPGLGRLNVVAEAPGDPQTLYVGAPSGGLWRSTTGGNAWEPLFDDLPTLGVSGIALHPTDADIIYVATGDGNGTDTYSMGVLKSTDGGATWNSTGLDWHLAQVRTTRALRMHPTDPEVLFCASSAGLWRTADGGDSWQLVAEGRFRDVEFKPGDPMVVYASTDAFFRSTDGGLTFVPITAGLPEASLVNRMELAVTPADPEVVYAVCGRSDNSGYRGLYRSTDGGASFALRSVTPNLFGYQEGGGDSGGQSWYDMAICADPDNADRVFVGGINVWRSNNGGQDWQIRSHWYWPSIFGYTHADIHDLVMVGDRLYCASDGGLYISTTNGNSWTDLSAGLDITQFYRLGGSELDPDLLLAGSQDNGTNLWAGDPNWLHVMGGDGMEAIIDPEQPDIMYCSQQNGALRRSFNGGFNWSPISNSINEPGAWVTPYVLAPSDPLRLYAGYRNVWRTLDRGTTWNTVSNFPQGTSLRAMAVAPSDELTVYCASLTFMRRTYTGAGPWTTISGGLPQLAVSSIAVHPTDPQLVYVSLSGQQAGEKVYVSQDGGDNWTNISLNLPNMPANSVVLDPQVPGALYLGTDLGVFYMDSTLGNWQPYSHGLPNVVINEVEVNQASGVVRAASYGRGMFESVLYSPSGEAPVASFTHGATGICAGSSITFMDASLEASPGRTWSFPGGTPESSTEVSPAVSYPATGTYTVSLTVSNGFGVDTYSAEVEVEVLTEELQLDIVLDDYPEETAWTLVNEVDGALVIAGGPYTGHTPGSSVSEDFCVASGCYVFTITDSFGDGICCGVGQGGYTLAHTGVGEITSGGEFDYEESSTFCVGSVAVAMEEAQSTMQVMPNPAEGAVEVLLSSAATGHLRLLDGSGRVVAVYRVQGIRTALDLGGLSAGTYLVEHLGPAGRMVKRLVVE